MPRPLNTPLDAASVHMPRMQRVEGRNDRSDNSLAQVKHQSNRCFVMEHKKEKLKQRLLISILKSVLDTDTLGVSCFIGTKADQKTWVKVRSA